MIIHYGYTDGSGEYYISIDSDRCDGCGKCVDQCPQSALGIVTEMIDLEDKKVAAVMEEHRKKIKYTCSRCKPELNKTPCVSACVNGAIHCSWKAS
ncbi:MAG TPA: 4Fe-4S dicluster domain-containing protein [Candidatus Bathyarchaeia archaeon]|nr:4Fe-4S dicluster domain-containing protein [Candidatus Bathyarchaeia archaeon]